MTVPVTKALVDSLQAKRADAVTPKVGAGEQWLVMDRWDDFQHPDATRTGVPPWIKTYTRLLANDEFLTLSHHLRGVLLGLWLEYATARRQLRDSTVALSRRLGHRVTTHDLEALNHAGFIHFSASKPASNLASKPARPEKRREEQPRASAQQPKPRPPENVCPICGADRGTPKKLREHLDYVHNLEGPELEAALAQAGQT
jgi:hypothetical protein